jgi:hypothetical protein
MITKGEAAKAKIRALAQGIKVWVLEPGKRYVSPSDSQQGTAYEVIIRSPALSGVEGTEPGDITCTCPGATHRGICKHIGVVMLRLEVDQELAQTDPSTRSGEERTLEDKLADLYPRAS